MGYSDLAKKRGTKLQLSWVPSLRRWKKNVNGKQHYYAYPNTLEGYQKALPALTEW